MGRKGRHLVYGALPPSALLRDMTKRPDTFRDLKKLQAKVLEAAANPHRYDIP